MAIGHTPGVLTDAADLAIGLMLAVGHRLAEGDALVRKTLGVTGGSQIYYWALT